MILRRMENNGEKIVECQPCARVWCLNCFFFVSSQLQSHETIKQHGAPVLELVSHTLGAWDHPLTSRWALHVWGLLACERQVSCVSHERFFPNFVLSLQVFFFFFFWSTNISYTIAYYIIYNNKGNYYDG